ncbi:MgtC/SapB family protein [Pallidibacillus pasinlerensis]|uniref:MgtC/SapB family protein n=1 Tax=Pallidibacillus pasinlerensis TaxID=2703818 RepID=A0ABX0A5U9_9BACI|nr:MgtC/SapB family protein [Pallidibacillus pasinlerensis]NCU18813.1 MgtC/SapB family protein [Pallidibacillus pasinlerensis]
MDYIDIEVLIKLGITGLLGLIIGLEREIKKKPLGLKTSLVISIVSCLLTIVSIESAYIVTGSTSGVNIQMDPLRLAAQIISGIGFLGAGVILRRGNDSISGLTTAAIIWGAAGIGIAVGAGFYIEAIAGALLIIISVEFIPFIMTLIGPKQLKERDIALTLTVENKEQVKNIIEEIKKLKISVQKLRIQDVEDGKHLIKLNIGVSYKLELTDLYDIVSKLDGVKKVDIESLH